MGLPFNFQREGLFKGVALAYFILFLHVVLLAVISMLVFFFSGLVHYMVWILLGGALLAGVWAYWFYRRIRREGRSLSQALSSPMFGGRSVEVSLLGGLATLKLGRPADTHLITDEGDDPAPRLEDPDIIHVRELAALAQMLEKELITPEEFASAKRRLLGN